ncbi:EamA family transporter [Fluoribacter dumoffii]|uniref:Predicted permease, DMT superfamily n=1 Tax=Fluoribacter dumoffii TaxID=463 RepID=A0A377GDX6_9GAMM|nr:DMT family transporter [Fluoribacter dumoffii]KTC91266.1 drug/transporter permease [Fluoribacter dumoffii NY 23]MCW8387566.1 EamA family transporter [Fluoribacter dumoffii]MCW8416888.1 EamA family transporter [Fluoribacter dumoffii]MCW8455272.1 EamA family transporter [Fluoribacter dumoffii]MCW8460650.1 EamA family transporter [Fluoribacter dumoffii]
MLKFHFSRATVAALGAALLFGGSTPFAKQLVGNSSPLILAGFLYLGSGIGLGFVRLIKDRGWNSPDLSKFEWLWLLAAIAFGGMIAPTALMIGLAHTLASTSSLLLNLEAVLTAVLAWIFFKESTDKRIILGMLLIVAGGVLLSWPQEIGPQNWLGVASIAVACLCWAIDNNLTRKISSSDALFIAGSKGFVAGIVNISLAFLIGLRFPLWTNITYTMILGFLGYGISLVLFVLALRGLGTARTGAYFSTAPFMGAGIAILFFQEPTSGLFWIAAVLMGIGVWIHLTERHTHVHTHEPLHHSHSHYHDQHHQHTHEIPWDGQEPHSHPHQHEKLTHTHHHYPDIHHRHTHKE